VDFVEPVTRLVASLRDVDRNRIFGAGFSRGGKGILELAGSLRLAKVITADAENLSSLSRVRPTTPVWLHVGEPTSQNIADAHAVLARDPSVQIFQADDGLPPSSGVVLTRRPQQDHAHAHVHVCRDVFGDRRVYEWLLR
jgi:hypothetical protein